MRHRDGSFVLIFKDKRTVPVSYPCVLPSDLLNTSDNLFKGALAENYVVQSLAAKGHELLYHKPDAGLEIDLLLDMPEGIIPVEIKKGRHNL